MNGFIKHFLTLSAILGVCFGAYAYVQERPTRLVSESQEALEKKISEERAHVLTYVDARDAAKTREIQEINRNFNEKFTIMMKMLEKMDDRLYDLQRGSVRDARSIDWESPEGS